MSQTEEKFYFVRHGQTEANLTNLACGSGWDIELNETGLAQAKALAESDKIEICRDVKTICVSPMLRAKQTAEAITQVLHAPIVLIDQLKEWHLGDWERGSWADLPSLHHPDTNPPNGESQMEFGMRVSAGLTAALAHPGPIMIVAHGGVWHAISRILSLPKGSIENCDLKCVRRGHSDEPWQLE
jgi:broad specificity phosphatase PhoE